MSRSDFDLVLLKSTPQNLRNSKRTCKMIRRVMVMNDQGSPHLVEFCEFQKQQELIRSIYRVLCSRAENGSNFIKFDSLFGSDSRLVYNTYATRYFVFIFDSSDNELAMLDLMQVFVEALGKCFSKVCELDMVFNFNKVIILFFKIRKTHIKIITDFLRSHPYCYACLIYTNLKKPFKSLFCRIMIVAAHGYNSCLSCFAGAYYFDEFILGGQVLEKFFSEVVKTVEEISIQIS
ncbi:AP-3 complex subunit sigma-like [Olea europaea var. sylvestris]|uniref:AP-3 complex subunit sigma-like n=1 Tax=Olea europaea var. sylvestris TaxID=158386 RepID=UPI000C1D25ED|nr:AP-3 complex subunit sigma-like [Olea europaea var. sylvestris]